MPSETGAWLQWGVIEIAKKSRQIEYMRLNGKYLKEAEEFLAKKDYAQASEKFWGACTEIVKAVAAKRGLELGTHRSLGEYVVRLQKEHPDWALVKGFSIANALHTNFYEDWFPPEIVKEDGEFVKEFIEKLRSLL